MFNHNIVFFSIIAVMVLAVAVIITIATAYGYPQKGAPIAGVVTKIVDGDTLDAKLTNNETVRIRLTLSDTPERSTMPGWLSAKTFTADKCPVGSLIVMDPDAGQRKSFNRNVAKVDCFAHTLQNAELVEQGYAVINHTRYCPITEFRNEPWTGC